MLSKNVDQKLNELKINNDAQICKIHGEKVEV